MRQRTSKLFVILDPDVYASEARWAAYVDDELRAWLPTDRERVGTVLLRPGAHRAGVELHIRYLPYLVVPLPPMTEVEKTSVGTALR